MSSLVVDFDDLGANHIISNMCQSHDCRDQLDKLHYANPAFKATLFAIPGEMTLELLNWCKANSSWIELAFHGFYHGSNYECEKLTYKEFDDLMEQFGGMADDYFVKGFKAPGWQISDDAYRWLEDNGWWVSDQSYNDNRRPNDLQAYVVDGKDFRVYHNGKKGDLVSAHHGHTWSCCDNGIGDQIDYLISLVKRTDEFKFVSEIIKEFVDEVSSPQSK